MTVYAPPENVKVPFHRANLRWSPALTDQERVFHFGGLKVTPLRLLLADQFRLPCEFGVSITDTVQDTVVLFSVQGLPVEFDILVG